MRPWLAALLVSACSAQGLPLTSGGGGGGGGSAQCASHTDAASCGADGACAIAVCNDCGGKPVFGRCYDKGGPPPTFQCPSCFAACNEYHDAQSCNADPRCVACVACPGGFQGCNEQSKPQPPYCQKDACSTCSMIGTEAACAARPDCHPVYSDASTCGPGVCCTAWKACVAGARASCSGALCNIAPPPCQAECGYVPSVVNGCWGACVKKSECG